jgi:hypothetical protein
MKDGKRQKERGVVFNWKVCLTIPLRLGRLARSPRDSLVSLESKCGALDDSGGRVAQDFLQCFNRFGRAMRSNSQALYLVPASGLRSVPTSFSIPDMHLASCGANRPTAGGSGAWPAVHHSIHFTRNVIEANNVDSHSLRPSRLKPRVGRLFLITYLFFFVVPTMDRI